MRRLCFTRKAIVDVHKRLHRQFPSRWCAHCWAMLRPQATVLSAETAETGKDISRLVASDTSFEGLYSFVLEQLRGLRGDSGFEIWEKAVDSGGRLATMST